MPVPPYRVWPFRVRATPPMQRRASSKDFSSYLPHGTKSLPNLNVDPPAKFRSVIRSVDGQKYLAHKKLPRRPLVFATAKSPSRVVLFRQHSSEDAKIYLSAAATESRRVALPALWRRPTNCEKVLTEVGRFTGLGTGKSRGSAAFGLPVSTTLPPTAS